MVDIDLIPWIFAAIMTVGVAYLLFSILLGGVADVDADVDADVGLDLDVEGALDGFDGALDAAGGEVSEARGIGCTVVAAFLAGFGSVGLLGSLSDWGLGFSILSGIAFGLIFGRTTVAVLRFVIRQQSTDLLTTQSLIGAYARVTVDTPAGHTGEALVEGDTLIKYPVQAVSDDVALSKGDYVEIVDVQQGRLCVKKKREA